MRPVTSRAVHEAKKAGRISECEREPPLLRPNRSGTLPAREFCQSCSRRPLVVGRVTADRDEAADVEREEGRNGV